MKRGLTETKICETNLKSKKIITLKDQFRKIKILIFFTEQKSLFKTKINDQSLNIRVIT